MKKLLFIITLISPYIVCSQEIEQEKKHNQYSIISKKTIPLENYLLTGSYQDNLEMIKIAIECGANVKSQEAVEALSIAISKENLDIINYLLEIGVDPNVVDDDWRHERAGLYRAIRVNNMKIIITLLKYGADPLIKSAYGKTALEIAKNNNLKELKTILENWPKIVQKKVEEAGFGIPHTNISQIIAQYAVSPE